MAAPPAAGTISTTATSVVAASSQANAASSQAAAATTQAAASTQAAVASSAAAAPNNAVSASTIVAAASSAANASSSASAISASASSASVSASASSSAAVFSSAIGSSSSSVSRISSSNRSNASAAAVSASTVASRKNSLSAGAIGGIAGGVVGGLAVLALVWFLWRRRRDKKDWVPPPPPREMNYNPQSMSRQRAMSNANMGGAGINRASSYSTLLHPRPPSTNQSHSRSPSYYASYPIATPSSMSHDNSPPLPMASNTGTSSTESSPPLSGLNTPAVKPALAPIDTSLQRDSSGSSDGRPFPRHKSSVDRLRQDAQVGFSRTGSMSSGHERNPSEGSSRATSPHPSMTGNSHRNSFSSSLTPVNHPRPYSSYSLTSQATGPQRVGGAPHQRYMNVTMPRLLGARPDENGDFFPGMPKSHESMHWNAKQDLQDFTPPSPVHTKRPSTLSMSSLPHPRHDASNGV